MQFNVNNLNELSALRMFRAYPGSQNEVIIDRKKEFDSIGASKVNKSLLAIYATCSILTPVELFVRTTYYGGGALRSLPTISTIFSALIIVIYMIKMRIEFKISNSIPMVLLFASFMIWFRFGFADADIPIALLIPLGLHVFVLTSIDFDTRKLLLNYIGTAFAIAMIPNLILFCLKIAGYNISLPIVESSNYLKSLSGALYYASPFGVLHISQNSIDYCGIYDEKGCVGTYAALILVAIDSQRCTKYKSSIGVVIVLFIEALMSFSFAGYIIIICYFIIRSIVSKNYKIVIVTTCIILASIFVLNLNIDNYALQHLNSRVNGIIYTGTVDDNRMSQEAINLMNGYYNSNDTLIKLFGFGPNVFNQYSLNNQIDASSVLTYLYNYGIIGIMLYYVTIVVCYIYPLRIKNVSFTSIDYIPLIMFLLSTYQRPGVFSVLGISILMLSAQKRSLPS